MPTKKIEVEETEPVADTQTLKTKILAQAHMSKTRWIVGGVLGVALVVGSVLKTKFNSEATLPTLES